jgi:hypothetical protein
MNVLVQYVENYRRSRSRWNFGAMLCFGCGSTKMMRLLVSLASQKIMRLLAAPAPRSDAAPGKIIEAAQALSPTLSKFLSESKLMPVCKLFLIFAGIKLTNASITCTYIALTFSYTELKS